MEGKISYPLDQALDYIIEAGSGIVVILRYVQNAEEVAFDLEQLTANQKPGSQSHLRLLGAGSQILSSLGARKISVLGRERKTHGLSGFDLEIVDYISKQ